MFRFSFVFAGDRKNNNNRKKFGSTRTLSKEGKRKQKDTSDARGSTQKFARMGRKKIQIARIMDERNRHVSKQVLPV